MNSITVPANINIARNFSELRTPNQLITIRAIANSQRIDPWDECQKVCGCDPEDLCQRSADEFIAHLRSQPRRSWSEVTA